MYNYVHWLFKLPNYIDETNLLSPKPLHYFTINIVILYHEIVSNLHLVHILIASDIFV